MPDFREIITSIKKKDFAPVYLLMGEEAYYIDRITEALEAAVVAEEDKEFDQSVLYGAETDAGMVMEAAGRYPMLSEKRFVALKEAQAMQRAKAELDKLKNYVASPNPATVLVVAFKGEPPADSSALLKEAKKNKNVVVFKSPKIKDWQLPGIIKDFCAAEKLSIEERAVEALMANVGADLAKLSSQIEKLKVVLKGEKLITADLVHENVGISKEFNAFELKAAIAKRDYFMAVNIVKYFEVNKYPTQKVLPQIFDLFQKLVLATFSSDKSEQAMLTTLQLKSAYALKDVRLGMQHYNAAQAVKAVTLIRQFDTKSKGIESTQKEYPLLLELVCSLITL